MGIASRRAAVWMMIVALPIAIAISAGVLHHSHAQPQPVAPNGAADTVYQAKDWDEAMAALDRAIRQQPQSGDLYTQRGATLEYLGRFDDAERDFVRATELQPASATNWHNLIAIRDWTRKTDGASVAAAYKQHVVGLEPSNALNHRNLAKLLDTAGQVENAEAEFAEAIRLEPQDGTLALEYAASLQEHGPGGRTRALKVLRDALARNASERLLIADKLGELAFTEKQYAIAAQAYSEAASLMPTRVKYRQMAEESRRRR